MMTTRPRPLLVLLVLVGTACRPSEPMPTWRVGPAEPIPGGEAFDHVFAADLDGDGTDDLGTVTGQTATINGTDHLFTGTIQRALAVPAGATEVAWLATGQGRADREAPIQVHELSAQGIRPIYTRPGERDQVTDLRWTQGKVWAALYADSRQVSGGWLSESGFEPLTTEHMAQRQVPLPDGSVVVGRVYGTAPKSPGDLRRLTPDAKSTALVSLRGVRALAIADVDADGHTDLISGDGWHFAYGREADARIVLHRGPDFTDTRVIGWVPESYAALDIIPVGSGLSTALVIQGSQRVVLLARDRLGWRVDDLGPISEVGNIAILDSERTPRVAISGPEPRLIPLWVDVP